MTIFSFSSCQDYNSDHYRKMENEAINDILLEMTNFERMKKLSGWKGKKPKLFIISKLNTTTSLTMKPDGYDVTSGGIDYSKEKIEENKKEFEEGLAKFEKEEQLFANLKNGKIKKRNLNYIFKNKELNIELIEAEKILNFDTKENEFGYLSLSRIIFNKDFTKGYLHFSFVCDNDCAWDGNIEIKKINGKWKISEYFSGGIA